MRKKVKNKIKDTSIYSIFIIVFVVIFFMTAGYSAFSDSLGITGSVGYVRASKVVRVNNVTTQSALVSEVNFDHNAVVANVNIPAGSSVTLTTTVTNLGSSQVAVANINPTNGTSTISNLTTNINENNFVKICDNNNCVGPVSKTFDITFTNTGATTISGMVYGKMTFSEVYEVSYNNTLEREVLSGSTFTKTFSGNAPSTVSIIGNYGNYTYSNNTLTINNITSNIDIYPACNIIYQGAVQDTVVQGQNYTHTYETDWPKTISISGTYGSYTYQNKVLNISNVGSDLTLTPTFGVVEITDIDYISSVNVQSQETPTFNGMSANFNIVFKRAADATTNDFNIVYRVTLDNDSNKDYIFRGFDFDPVITASAGGDSAVLDLDVDGVENGELLPPGESKTFDIILTLDANNPNGTYTADVGAEVDGTNTTTEQGTIDAEITPTTGDLRSPATRVPFTLEVESTFADEREFRIISSNSNLQLVDANNNPLTTLTIDGNTTDTYTIYVIKNSSAMFSSNEAATTIYLSTDGLANIEVETLTFQVDVSANVDRTKVTVSNATTAMVYDSGHSYPTPGSLQVSWQRDDQGGSEVVNYTVLLYNSSNELKGTGNTNSGLTNYTFTSLADDTYYAVVYGEDAYHNSGAEDAASATTAAGYATKSSSTAYKWRFNVNVSGLTRLNASGDHIAYLGQNYQTTITPTNNYRVPSNASDWTVKMGGRTLSSGSNGFNWNRSSNSQGTLTVYNVSGDIELTATATSGTCLVEGTKVLLANGQYKNIENINYDDLLMVYSYETGEFVPEYPIWIEKTKTTNTYQKNTFSDGTVLKTVGWHGLYSSELNRFVTVDQPQEFHVGSKIVKLDKQTNSFKTITVTNIETINETTNYYHVVSTRYYNIIANDLLTTDGTTILSNLYGFTDKMTWPKDIRNYALKDVYTYEDLQDAIPYYMYKGLRAEEGKLLASYGLDLNTFKGYLLQNQNNPAMLKEPIKKFNHNVWMVTTSEDNVTELNKNNYLKTEGTVYKVPKSKNKKFLKWLNTADNKTYLPGDKVTVNHGIYLKAIYKEH